MSNDAKSCTKQYTNVLVTFFIVYCIAIPYNLLHHATTLLLGQMISPSKSSSLSSSSSSSRLPFLHRRYPHTPPSTMHHPIPSLLLLLLLASSLSLLPLVSSQQRQLLLNAYNSPIEAINTPHALYLLEFPLPPPSPSSSSSATSVAASSSFGNEGDNNNNSSSNKQQQRQRHHRHPQCENGTPFSFLYRRGSDVHLNKILIEFEGSSSGSSHYTHRSVSTAVPWYNLLRTLSSSSSSSYTTNNNDNNDIINKVIPSLLSSCNGISSGYLNFTSSNYYGIPAANMLGFDHYKSDATRTRMTTKTEEVTMTTIFDNVTTNSTTSTVNDNDDSNDGDLDIPIFLRRSNHKNNNNNNNAKAWWEELSGEYSNMYDWSYIFVPHCTPSDNNGNASGDDADAVSTMNNVEGVLHWITAQFAQRQQQKDYENNSNNSNGGSGLDALIAVSGGGRFGGCQQQQQQRDNNNVVVVSSPASTSPTALLSPPGNEEEEEEEESNKGFSSTMAALSFIKRAATTPGLFKRSNDNDNDDDDDGSSSTSSSSKALVIVDGATLWNEHYNNNNSPASTSSSTASSSSSSSSSLSLLSDQIQGILSPTSTYNDNTNTNIQIVWIASPSAMITTNEYVFLQQMTTREERKKKKQNGNSILVHRPTTVTASNTNVDDDDDGGGGGRRSCQRYAFSDNSIDDTFHIFLRNVIKNMSWSSSSNSNSNNNSAKSSSSSSSYDNNDSSDNWKLSFLSIFVILLGLYILSWMVYYYFIRLLYRRRRRSSSSDKQQDQRQQRQASEEEDVDGSNLQQQHQQRSDDEGNTNNEDTSNAAATTNNDNATTAVAAATTTTTSNNNSSKSTTTIIIPTPHDLWFKVLTTYPILFLIVSILLPTILSIIAILFTTTESDGSSGLQINLNFETYLNIDTREERIMQQYDTLVEYQKTSLKEEERHCNLLLGGKFGGKTSFDNDRQLMTSLLQDEGHDGSKSDEYGDLHQPYSNHQQALEQQQNSQQQQQQHRQLQDYSRRNGRSVINFFYQNRSGGNVLTPKLLESIRQFEKSLLTITDDFDDYCYGADEIGKCYPFSSIIPYFYPTTSNNNNNNNEEEPKIVQDIDSVLRALSGSKSALAKLDRYFGKNDNYQSNVTISHVMLNDVNGRNRENTRAFLKRLHNELWRIDQGNNNNQDNDLLITWRNTYMSDVEASQALQHDGLWSGIALLFIGTMIYIKIRSLFLMLAGILGLVLSFTSALYWCRYHFDFNELNAMHVAGIFVMLGIGADDIFLSIDSFEHTKVDYIKKCQVVRDGGSSSSSNSSSNTESGKQQLCYLNDSDIIKQRLISSYKTAGSMMLVSSVTTAICFFSNIMSAVISIRDFGSYMGMVVVLNYIHVMTILPSAILVYEIHIKPWRERMWTVLCPRRKKDGNSDGNTNGDEVGVEAISSNAVIGDANDTNAQSTSVISNYNESNTATVVTDEEAGAGGENAKSGAPHSDEEAGDEHVDNAETGVPFISATTPSQPVDDDDWHENGVSRTTTSAKTAIRDIATPVTITSSNQELDNEESSEARGDHLSEDADYAFLKHTKEMSSLDRYFVEKHAPAVYKFRRMIISSTFLVAIALGILAYFNFTLYDGTIVVFKAKYNLGRVQKIVDEYFPKELVSKYSEEIITIGGNDVSSVEGDIEIIGGNYFDSSDLDTAPPPITNKPTPRLISARPSSVSPTPQPLPQPSSPSVDNNVAAPNEDFNNASPVIGTVQTPPSGSDEQNIITVSVPAVAQSTSPLRSPSSVGEGGTGSGGSAQNSPTIVSTATVPTPATINTPSSPTRPPIPQFNCPPGLPCLVTNGDAKTYKRKQYYAVSIVWGMRTVYPDPNIWVIRDNTSTRKNDALDNSSNNVNYIDPTDPHIQEWLLKLVDLARNDPSLRLHPQQTWIEVLRDFAVENGFGFPISSDLFIGVVELLKGQSSSFRTLVDSDLATRSPGLAGDFLFTGLSVLSEVPSNVEDYTSDTSLRDWSAFARSINAMLQPDLPPINIQSDRFLNSMRTTAIVDSTVSSYFFANGLYLVVMLLFIGNLLLTLSVMVSLLLILACLSGLVLFVFRIEFGPVESLGVSIFVGLSANYLLHIAHAYKSKITERNIKIQRAIFVTGSPILWSALSTIGGSMFLFACRTWLLTELGILICTIIGLSLICSIGFLLAFLGLVGPLPLDHTNLHSYDLMLLFRKCCCCIDFGKSESVSRG